MTAPVAAAYTDLARFSELRREARTDREGAYDKVAREFEAVFVELMLKAARDATIESDLFGSSEMKLYREMFDSQAAHAMAEGPGLGFAELLRGQMAPSDQARGTATDRDGLAPPRRVATPTARAAAQDFEGPPGRHEVEGWRSDADRLAAAGLAPEQVEFVERLRPHAERAAERLGTTADVIVAQAILETGWGRHVIGGTHDGSNNFFGVKAGGSWGGPSVDVATREFVGNRPLTVRAAFRAYPDEASAFDDYVNLITDSPRYRAALEAPHPDGYIRALQAAGYATDPRYADKVSAIRSRLNEHAEVVQPTVPRG